MIFTRDHPYIINNIAYDIADSKIRSYLEADSAQTLLHEGMRFDVNVLDEERQRITQYLQNRGYYRLIRILSHFRQIRC